MEFINNARRKFTASYLGDISKAIFAVGLASKLFIELARWLRISLIVTSIILFMIAFFIQPAKEGEKK